MTEKIYTLIDMALEEAKSKHPVFPVSPVERCSIMMEEAGEAVQAANDMFFGEIYDKTQKELLRTELLHTACVCVRILEAMEAEETESEHCGEPLTLEEAGEALAKLGKAISYKERDFINEKQRTID